MMGSDSQELTQTDLSNRFWENVQVADGDNCWGWAGWTVRNGYGAIRCAGELEGRRYITAHRLSWMLHFGNIPDGLWVLHRCDNPPCVRPDHLFLGTASDNARDMVSKGRWRHGDTAGEKHWITALTWDDVEAIRARYQRGSVTYEALATEYGLSRAAIGDIIRGVTWVNPDYTPPHDGGPQGGESHWNAQLNWEVVREIRSRYRPQKISYEKLAASYGVSKGTIADIIQGKTWVDESNPSKPYARVTNKDGKNG